MQKVDVRHVVWLLVLIAGVLLLGETATARLAIAAALIIGGIGLTILGRGK